MNKYKPVYIEWIDSMAATPNWLDLPRLSKRVAWTHKSLSVPLKLNRQTV
jgi:hypothetical protein